MEMWNPRKVSNALIITAEEDTTTITMDGIFVDDGTRQFFEMFLGESNYISYAAFKRELESINTSRIHLDINSPGGDASEAAAIRSSLQKLQSNGGVQISATVDGLAASAATFVLLAADDISVGDLSTIMIHPPSSFAMGSTRDFKAIAEGLEKFENAMVEMYANKLTVSAETVREWFNEYGQQGKIFVGEEAVEIGFADRVISSKTSGDQNITESRNTSRIMAQRFIALKAAMKK